MGHNLSDVRQLAISISHYFQHTVLHAFLMRIKSYTPKKILNGAMITLMQLKSIQILKLQEPDLLLNLILRYPHC